MASAFSPQYRFYQLFQKIEAELKRHWLSWTLLGLAFMVGCITIYHGQFVDEADNLVLGSQILRGDLLYKDLFSHHFPFTYYWSAMVIALAGKSIFFTRLSIWIFQIAAIAIAMQLSGFHISLALTALIWAVLRPIYRGNFVLYSAFNSAALLLIFAVIVSILLGKTRPRRSSSIAIGICSTIAILSDPLSLYPVTVGLLALALRDFKQGLLAGLTTASGGLLYGLALLATQSIADFWQQAILFNAQVYGRYSYADPNRLKLFGSTVINGLGITNPAWWNFDPHKPITMIYAQFDKWAFTGLLYRLAILASAIILTLKKYWQAGIFIVMFAAAAVVINPGDFRGIPFVLCGILAVCGIITGEWLGRAEKKVQKISQWILAAFFGVMIAWVIVASFTYYYENRGLLLPQAHFQNMGQEAERLKQLTCGSPDVRLAHFPGGVYQYWFTDLQPATRYLYLWPWVADFGQVEIIDDLDNEDELTIVVRYDDIIWDRYNTRDYLRPLDEFLQRRYTQVREGIFLSPALAARCASQ